MKKTEQMKQTFAQLNSVSSCLEMRDMLTNSGEMAELKASLASASPAEKKDLGRQLNVLRQEIQAACDERILEIQMEAEKDTFTEFDPTFYYSLASEKNPVSSLSVGAMHPITLVTQEIVEIFGRMGFDVFDGPQVENQWNNFTSVGTPDYHPARTMQDTFFLEEKDENGEKFVLRTQVTANICRYGETKKPPFGVIFPGIVFRAENIDATHDINFHQFDMWLVQEKTSTAQLTTLIQKFFAQFFEEPDMQIRLRPSYFPFTQPSFEGDVFCKWFKGGRWVEVFGAGPVHTQVLENMGLDPQKWQGLAFGFGLTRLAQLKFRISGLGQFYNGHLDFLRGK